MIHHHNWLVNCRTLGNGCVTYYEYDNIGRTSRVENRKGDGSMISSFDYARDAVGNPISIEREDGYTVYYEYDAKHQLSRETHVDEGEVIYAWEWDYDAAGNREYQVFNGEATYYEYNAANELTTETKGGEVTYYHYDRCGNTIAKQEVAGTTYYHWDYENLLTQIDLPDGAHNYFAYDADGKRVSKRDSEGFTEFIYQGPNMLALQLERDEAGETQVQYTMGAGLESMRRADGGDIASGDSSFYHYDWLGSTHELTDDEQMVTDAYLYNAWGEVLERTGTTDNPHQWVGLARYYVAADAPLSLLGLRYCNWNTGRFLSRDPLRFGGHPYLYTMTSVNSHVDPTGMHAWPQEYSPRPISPTAEEEIERKLRMWTESFGKTPVDAAAYLQAIVSESLLATAAAKGYWNAFKAHNYWRGCTGGRRSFGWWNLTRDVPQAKEEYEEHIRAACEAARHLGMGRHQLMSPIKQGQLAFKDLGAWDWHFVFGEYKVQGVADTCVGEGGVVGINMKYWFFDEYAFDETMVGLPFLGHLHNVGWARNYVNVEVVSEGWRRCGRHGKAE